MDRLPRHPAATSAAGIARGNERLLGMLRQNSTTSPTVVLDLAKLKFLNCGVGRLCLHLAKALLQHGSGRLHCRFLLPRDRQHLFPGHEQQCIAVRHYHRQRVRAWSRCLGLRPFQDLRCSVWHWTHQDSEYWPPDTDVPVVLNILDLNFLYEGKGRLKTQQRLRRVQQRVDRSSCVVAISEFTAREIRRHLDVGIKPVHVVPMGVESSEPCRSGRPEFLPSGEFLYTIGDISPKKNFRVLIDLAERLPEFRFVIAGRKSSSYARTMEREIRRRKLAGRVLMPGEVNDDVRQWLYQNCTAFLFPTMAEGFGLPVIEAMKLGRPVIMSRRTSLPEIGGPLGFYWDSFEPDSMAAVLRRSLRHVSGDGQFGAKLRRYAAQFSWKRAAEQYLAIYQSVSTGQGIANVAPAARARKSA